MANLSVQNLSKSYGGRDLFREVQFDVAEGVRLALVGPNGCGKSTLLRMLAGEIEPDTGRITTSRDARIGYVAQDLSAADLELSLRRFVMASFPSWSRFWQQWEEAAAAHDEAALARLGKEQARLEGQFGYSPEHKAEAVLHGLGFTDAEFTRPLKTLSGGWRERAKLAKVLVQGTDLLLLDEPTNHLDLEAVEWLEEYVKTFGGGLVFVAHDRVFLDNVATHVLYLGGGKPVLKQGNFSFFLDWQAEHEKVRERQAAKLSATIDRQMTYISRFRVTARKASQAQSKLKQVEKMKESLEGLAGEARRRVLDFDLPKPARGDKAVVRTEGLNFSFPGSPPLWPPLDFVLYRGQKVALAAPNGAGKTTLLKLITGELKPTAGKIDLGPRTTLGYFSQHALEVLNPQRTVVDELRRLSDPDTTEEELRAVLGLFLLGESYFDSPVARLSGGEKSRLVLASLFLARANFLVLDEPTNHLDLESREGLIEALKAYEGTIFMVAHDRYLLSSVAEEVWALSEGGITVHLDGFEEYDRIRKAALKAAPDLTAGRSIKRKLDKDEKRRRAEERNRLYREVKPRKDAYAKLEAELSATAAEQHELEARLADPATYADHAEFMRLTTQYQKLKAREEELFERMLPLEEEIGRLEAAREAIAEDEA